MSTIKPKYIAGLALVAAFTTACSEKMPTVNDENCTQSSIQKIEDNQMREEFSEQCFDYKIEQGKETANNLLEDSQDAAEDAYDNTAEAVEDGYDNTANAMEEGADAVGDAWDDSVDAVEDGADEAEQEMDQAAN